MTPPRHLRIVRSESASTQHVIEVLEAAGLALSFGADRFFRVVSPPFGTMDDLAGHLVRHGWEPFTEPGEGTEGDPACPQVGDSPALGEEPDGPLGLVE